MPNFSGNVTASNVDGVPVGSAYTVNVIAALAVITSVTVVPLSAPAGTLRTVTINATGAVSYTCNKPDGTPATATAQPNVFTMVI